MAHCYAQSKSRDDDGMSHQACPKQGETGNLNTVVRNSSRYHSEWGLYELIMKSIQLRQLIIVLTFVITNEERNLASLRNHHHEDGGNLELWITSTFHSSSFHYGVSHLEEFQFPLRN